MKKGSGNRCIDIIIGAGLCMMLLVGCGQVQTTEGTGEQSSTAVSDVEEGREANQNDGRPAESEKTLAEATAASESSDFSASVQENRIVVSDTLYDDVLNPIGAILFRQVTLFSETEPEKVMYEFDATWPEIDVSFAGADKINETMLEYVNHLDALMTQNQTWEDEPVEVNAWFSSSFEGFTYRDDHYISFIQKEYDFAGGAHGMPYHEPFTFQLQTGERLELADIIGNSEEELKEIVTGYFAEMINAAPEEYSEGAVETVREAISLESYFVLTPEGIQFYLMPYEIASYAAGFPSVIVPYEEFEMKIVLEPLG